MACPTRHCRSRRLCRRPAGRFRTPRGSPTVSVPTRRATAAADHRLGRLVLRLADPPPVPALDQPLPGVGTCRHRRDPRWPGLGARAATARWRALVSARCMRCSARIARPDTSSPHPSRSGDRVGVDDTQIHPGDPGRVRFEAGRVGGDRDLGGHIQVQPATVMQQGDRPDLLGRVRDRPGQPQPQRRTAARDRHPHPAPLGVEGERAVVVAHRHHEPPPPRKPGLDIAGLAFRRAANHASEYRRNTDRAPTVSSSPNVPGPDAAQFPAQLLIGRPTAGRGAATATG